MVAFYLDSPQQCTSLKGVRGPAVLYIWCRQAIVRETGRLADWQTEGEREGEGKREKERERERALTRIRD